MSPIKAPASRLHEPSGPLVRGHEPNRPAEGRSSSGPLVRGHEPNRPAEGRSSSGPLVRGRVPLAGPLFIALAVVLLAAGSAYGLLIAPPERYMGDVQRIMYVHVPTAWNALLALTLAFGCAVAFLFTRRWGFDAVLESAVEVGVVFAFLLCIQGSLWAKPTWGVFWDWDPRLTTVAVMLFAFLGVLALRRFVEDPVRRATWSAVATIISFADVPLVYFSVRWWNSLHQVQSSPQTVDRSMVLPLRINAFGMLALLIGFVVVRSALARKRLADELAPPLAATLAQDEAAEPLLPARPAGAHGGSR
jgi:heme exporter protein C